MMRYLEEDGKMVLREVQIENHDATLAVIGRSFRDRRMALRMTMREVAFAASVPVRDVSLLENGRAAFSGEFMRSYEAAFKAMENDEMTEAEEEAYADQWDVMLETYFK